MLLCLLCVVSYRILSEVCVLTDVDCVILDTVISILSVCCCVCCVLCVLGILSSLFKVKSWYFVTAVCCVILDTVRILCTGVTAVVSYPISVLMNCILILVDSCCF